MKLKLVILVLATLSTAGCMTTSNSYSRDIVYRDGSYYSPADDDNGDYYYEPEADYGDYDDYGYYNDYGYGQGYHQSYFGNSWYGQQDSYRCRLSYYYDHYCNNSWGSSFLNFGGLTLIFGNSHQFNNGYGYGHGYGGGYPGYGYYGGYPYYSGYTPSPQPQYNGPRPVSKPPTRPGPTDTRVGSGYGIRVSGEPVRMQVKPGFVENDSDEITTEPATRGGNPYTRREQSRTDAEPGRWRETYDQRSAMRAREIETAPRARRKPDVVRANQAYENAEAAATQYRQPQVYQRERMPVRERQPQPELNYARADTSTPMHSEPSRQVIQQERQTPQIQRQPRIERPVRSEQPARRAAEEAGDEGNGAQ